jgi:hypothetical protein
MSPVGKDALARVARSQVLAGVSRRRKRIALAVAAASDVAQMAFFPAFVEGAASPFEIALDVATAIAILVIVGFRWRLAIALAVELVPGADLFPTWTAVVASLPAHVEESRKEAEEPERETGSA